jgi:hypothetical protein
LGDALRRRSIYLRVEHPTAEREASIVARKTPNCAPATHRFIAGFAKALRGYNLEKSPSISEMNDVAQALELLGITEIRPEHKSIMLPLVVKTEKDINKLSMKEAFEDVVAQASDIAEQMRQDELQRERYIAGLATALRGQADILPSASNMKAVVQALTHMGLTEIQAEHKDVILPLVAMTEADVNKLLKDELFECIIKQASEFAEQMRQEDLQREASAAVTEGVAA